MFAKMKNVLFAGAFALSLGCAESTSAQTVELKDDNGDGVSVPEKVERIAVAWPVITSIILSLDKGPDRLVAIPQQSKQVQKQSLLAKIYPEIQKVSLKAVDRKRNVIIEEMLTLEPDVLFELSSKIKSIRGLRDAGLTVFGLKSSPSDLDEKLITAISTVIDRQERAKEILRWRQTIFNRIQEKTRSISEAKRPSFVYLWHRQQLIGLSHHMTSLLKKAGGKNALMKSQRFIGWDAEMLLQTDPDFIFLHNLGVQKTPADFYSDPVFADLTAVKNRTIYKVPTGVGSSWDGPSQERALALEWFTRILHGNSFLKGSMSDALSSAYPILYGRELDEKLLGRILMVEANLVSAGYVSMMK